MINRYDVLVVGSGPAGSAAAYVLANAGRRVALIDRASFPRDKLCGGGVTGRARRVFEDVFGPDFPEMDRHTSFDFWANGQSIGRMDGMPAMYLTTRRSFDAELRDRAINAGADPITAQVAQVDEVSQTVVLNDGTRLGYELLIGADGVKSVVARHIFGESFEADKIGFALEVEAPPSPQADAIRIDFGAAKWGYGWHFPKSGSITIGVGGLAKRNDEMKARLNEYLDLTCTTEYSRVKGHHLPFGSFRTVPGRGRLLLVGDAAGLVDPITGEGIGHAMDSGAKAAKAAIEALQNGAPETALASYTKALGPIHRSLRQARAIRWMVYAGPFENVINRAMGGAGRLRRDFLALLAGEQEYDDIIRTALWHLPAYAKRIVSKAKPSSDKK